MAQPSILDRPSRWDVPFAEEEARYGLESGGMTDGDVDRLMDIAPFSRMDEAQFPENCPLRGILRNDTRIQRYAKGEVVVRQGDYGNSSFLILEGQVRVLLDPLDPTTLGRLAPRKKSRWQSLRDAIFRPRSVEVRDPRSYPQYRAAPSDKAEDHKEPDEGAPVRTNILWQHPGLFETSRTDVMGEGQVFGELAALGRIPRAKTVVADGQVELLEIRWQGLRDLRLFDAAIKAHIDEQYRRFGLASTLSDSPLLEHLPPQTIERIAATAQFETYGRFDWHGTYKSLRDQQHRSPLADEPLIAEEGHYPNGLILIRAGFARLSRAYGQGERTLNYLRQGDVYGVIELMRNSRQQEPQPLLATLRAIGYVDVVRIPTPSFEQNILPSIKDPDVSALRLTPSLRESDLATIDSSQMEFLVDHRVINGTATMVIDLDRCVRCDDCVNACASGHSNNPRFVRHGRVFDRFMIANACMHCMDPVCMIGCPTGAIHRTEGEGQVVINDQTCIGCATCADSCPYDNIRMVEVRDETRDDAIMVKPTGDPIVKATKCDLCIDHHGGPACERACPHDALHRVDMREIEDLRDWQEP